MFAVGVNGIHLWRVATFVLVKQSRADRSVRVVLMPESEVSRLLGLRIRILSLLSVVWCQEHVCATGRSLIQTIPIDCGVWSSATASYLSTPSMGYVKRHRLKKSSREKPASVGRAVRGRCVTFSQGVKPGQSLQVTQTFSWFKRPVRTAVKKVMKFRLS